MMPRMPFWRAATMAEDLRALIAELRKEAADYRSVSAHAMRRAADALERLSQPAPDLAALVEKWRGKYAKIEKTKNDYDDLARGEMFALDECASDLDAILARQPQSQSQAGEVGATAPHPLSHPFFASTEFLAAAPVAAAPSVMAPFQTVTISAASLPTSTFHDDIRSENERYPLPADPQAGNDVLTLTREDRDAARAELDALKACRVVDDIQALVAEAVDDLPDDEGVSINIGKRATMILELGDLRRLAALMQKGGE